MSEFRTELQNRSELKCTCQARNPELAVVCLPDHKSPELVVVWGQKSGVGCSIIFVSKIRSSLKYIVHVRNRELAAIYVSGQKSGEGCGMLFKSNIGRALQYTHQVKIMEVVAVHCSGK